MALWGLRCTQTGPTLADLLLCCVVPPSPRKPRTPFSETISLSITEHKCFTLRERLPVGQRLSGALGPRSSPGFSCCFRYIQGSEAEGLEGCSGFSGYQHPCGPCLLIPSMSPHVHHLIILPSVVLLGPQGPQAAQGSPGEQSSSTLASGRPCAPQTLSSH